MVSDRNGLFDFLSTFRTISVYLLVIKASFDVLKTTLSLGVGSCSSPRRTDSIYKFNKMKDNDLYTYKK